MTLSHWSPMTRAGTTSGFESLVSCATIPESKSTSKLENRVFLW